MVSFHPVVYIVYTFPEEGCPFRTAADHRVGDVFFSNTCAVRATSTFLFPAPTLEPFTNAAVACILLPVLVIVHLWLGREDHLESLPVDQLKRPVVEDTLFCIECLCSFASYSFPETFGGISGLLCATDE